MQNSWTEVFPPALLLIIGIFFNPPACTRAGVWCLTTTAEMQSCCLLVLKRHDRTEPDSCFRGQLLHVSDRPGDPANSRQEKGTVSSRYHFSICFPVLIQQSDVKKTFAWRPPFPRAVLSLGMSFHRIVRAELCLLELGSHLPATNQHKSLFSSKAPLLAQMSSRNFARVALRCQRL